MENRDYYHFKRILRSFTNRFRMFQKVQEEEEEQSVLFFFFVLFSHKPISSRVENGLLFWEKKQNDFENRRRWVYYPVKKKNQLGVCFFFLKFLSTVSRPGMTFPGRVIPDTLQPSSTTNADREIIHTNPRSTAFGFVPILAFSGRIWTREKGSSFFSYSSTSFLVQHFPAGKNAAHKSPPLINLPHRPKKGWWIEAGNPHPPQL